MANKNKYFTFSNPLTGGTILFENPWGLTTTLPGDGGIYGVSGVNLYGVETPFDWESSHWGEGQTNPISLQKINEISVATGVAPGTLIQLLNSQKISEQELIDAALLINTQRRVSANNFLTREAAENAAYARFLNNRLLEEALAALQQALMEQEQAQRDALSQAFLQQLVATGVGSPAWMLVESANQQLKREEKAQLDRILAYQKQLREKAALNDRLEYTESEKADSTANKLAIALAILQEKDTYNNAVLTNYYNLLAFNPNVKLDLFYGGSGALGGAILGGLLGNRFGKTGLGAFGGGALGLLASLAMSPDGKLLLSNAYDEIMPATDLTGRKLNKAKEYATQKAKKATKSAKDTVDKVKSKITSKTEKSK